MRRLQPVTNKLLPFEATGECCGWVLPWTHKNYHISPFFYETIITWSERNLQNRKRFMVVANRQHLKKTQIGATRNALRIVQIQRQKMPFKILRSISVKSKHKIHKKFQLCMISRNKITKLRYLSIENHSFLYNLI